jgi:hypothetical protein
MPNYSFERCDGHHEKVDCTLRMFAEKRCVCCNTKSIAKGYSRAFQSFWIARLTLWAIVRLSRGLVPLDSFPPSIHLKPRTCRGLSFCRFFLDFGGSIQHIDSVGRVFIPWELSTRQAWHLSKPQAGTAS